MEVEAIAPAKKKMSPVLIAILGILGICLLTCLISVCLAFVLPKLLQQPVINQLSDMSTQIALTLTP
jgi:hypothetical protein